MPQFAHAARAALLTLIAALALLAGAPAARAGSYSVRVCDATGVNRAFHAYGDGVWVVADPTCRPQFTGTGYQSGGMRVRNSVNAPGVSSLAPLFATGGLRAQAPPGTFITRLRGSATAVDDQGATAAEGWRAGISDDVGPLWCGYEHACTWAGPPMVGIDIAANAAATRLEIAATCALWTGCLRDRLRAVVDLDNATIDVSDVVAPQVASVEDGWTSGWASGAVTAALRATDGAGVRRTWMTIDGGAAQGTTPFSCDPYAMAPCPADSGTIRAQLALSGLADGRHTLELHAEDAGGNPALVAVPLQVDNTAPAIGTVQSLTGSAWQRVNGFDLQVGAADGAGGSGVRRLHWEVCREDGSSCTPGSLAAGDGQTAVRVAVPAPGAWRARFWAADALRAGAKSDWSAPLRFDDTVPGAAAVLAPDGWTRDDAPQVTLELPAGATRGPSGVSGFALATGDGLPATTAAIAGDRPQVAIPHLPEGVTTIRARAIGGSGVSSTAVGSTQIRVDRTPPIVGVARDPDGADADWVGRRTRVAVHAQDALAGMAPAPPGAPAAAGARIAYAIDGGDTVVVPGADATIDVEGTGDHAIALRAYDAAGNVSRERLLRVRVDLTPPAGFLQPRDPARPRRLNADVDDVCLQSARLELRRRGTLAWTTLEATIEGRRVWADVPDERLAAGSYEVRFRVEDCAGNVGLIDRFAGQGAATGGTALRLPLRAQLAIAAAFDDAAPGSARTVRTVPLGTTLALRAAVADADGSPVVGREVHVQERIGTGDWRTVATRVTTADGEVRATLAPGPSRALRLVAEADEQTVGGTSATLRVVVPARVTIRLDRSRLRNGQAARFSGRVLGGHLPPGGRELELQGFNPLRGRWQPVRTSGLRCDASGAWHASYRFTATRGTVRYRFRLRVPPRPDHPFATGYSRAVTVVVRG